MSQSLPTIAVIIPYYQVDHGILRKTLTSICNQTAKSNFEIIVVDDESPAPPSKEIEAVDPPPNVRIIVEKQKNKGPGAARNTGLSLASNADYIAFLDSDDEWHETFTERCLALASQGFEYILGMYSRDGASTSSLRNYFPDEIKTRDIEGIDYATELLNPLVHFSMRGPICSTSCLFLDHRFCKGVVFDEDLRTAGEDSLFGARLAIRNPKVAIFEEITCRAGRGVNIFSDGEWFSDKGINRAFSRIKADARARKLFRHENKVAARNVTRKICRSIVSVFGIYAARKRRGLDTKLFWQRFREVVFGEIF